MEKSKKDLVDFPLLLLPRKEIVAVVVGMVD
jgi:hypothetical protein